MLISKTKDVRYKSENKAHYRYYQYWIWLIGGLCGYVKLLKKGVIKYFIRCMD